MKKFNSLSEIQNHLNTSEGMNLLLTSSNISYALQSEAERLQKYLVEEIDDYYNDGSYKPKVYERTGRWLESIKITSPIQIGNKFSISITFDESLANHPSWLGQEDGYVPWLMELGWDIRDKFNGADNRFTHFEGTHYIYRACQRWNRDNKFGFKITVLHGNERYI